MLSLTIGALPAAFPVAYALRQDQPILRVEPSGVIARKVAGQIVSLVAFDIRDEFDSGWMVTTTGRAELLAGPVERRACDALPLPHWTHYDIFVCVRTDVMSGDELIGVGQRRVANVPI